MKIKSLILSLCIALALLVACAQASQPNSAEKATPAAAGSYWPFPEETVDSWNTYIMIIYDDSSSMDSSKCAGDKGSRIKGSKWALREYLPNAPQDIYMGLYVLNKGFVVPFGIDNRQNILAVVDVLAANGNTPLNRAIRESADELGIQRARQLGYGRFGIIVLSDGEANDGPEDASEGINWAQSRERFNNELAIFTVGYCLSEDHALRNRSLVYRSADNPQGLLEALMEIKIEN